MRESLRSVPMISQRRDAPTLLVLVACAACLALALRAQAPQCAAA